MLFDKWINNGFSSYTQYQFNNIEFNYNQKKMAKCNKNNTKRDLQLYKQSRTSLVLNPVNTGNYLLQRISIQSKA